jgi:hypothetical protein
MAIDGELPILEYLYFAPSRDEFVILEMFRSPRLRHFILTKVDFPMSSPLLMTHVGLVTLSLQNLDEFVFLTRNDLLQILAPISHLETLKVSTFIPTPYCGQSIQVAGCWQT